MKNIFSKLNVIFWIFAVILISGCAGSPPGTNTPAAQSVSQSVSQPAAPSAVPSPQPMPAGGATENGTTDAGKLKLLSNRVDVIYFHVNQRCPTCICFEQRLNRVVEAYFADAISSGKMTYSVLNIQQEQNADVVKRYGAVGSQLFINTVVDDKDHIEDIMDIWNWNCRYNTAAFDKKVRAVIDYAVKGVR